MMITKVVSLMMRAIRSHHVHFCPYNCQKVVVFGNDDVQGESFGRLNDPPRLDDLRDRVDSTHEIVARSSKNPDHVGGTTRTTTAQSGEDQDSSSDEKTSSEVDHGAKHRLEEVESQLQTLTSTWAVDVGAAIDEICCRVRNVEERTLCSNQQSADNAILLTELQTKMVDLVNRSEIFNMQEEIRRRFGGVWRKVLSQNCELDIRSTTRVFYEWNVSFLRVSQARALHALSCAGSYPA